MVSEGRGGERERELGLHLSHVVDPNKCDSHQNSKDIVFRSKRCGNTTVNKTILDNKNKNGGITISGFKMFYRAVIIQIALY